MLLRETHIIIIHHSDDEDSQNPAGLAWFPHPSLLPLEMFPSPPCPSVLGTRTHLDLPLKGLEDPAQHAEEVTLWLQRIPC